MCNDGSGKETICHTVPDAETDQGVPAAGVTMLEQKRKQSRNRLPGKGKYVLCIFGDGDLRVYNRMTVPREEPLDALVPFVAGHVCSDNKEALIHMALLGRDERWSHAPVDMTDKVFLEE